MKRSMNVLGICAILFGVLGCQEPNMRELGNDASPQQTEKVYVRLPARVVSRDFVERSGFIRDHKQSKRFAFGYMDRDALEQLSNINAEDIVELDAVYSRADFDADTLEIKSEGGVEIFATEPGAENYHDYDALTKELQTLATEFPGITKLESAGKSVEGRELWLIKISDNAAADEDEPKLLYVANMHGDEVVGRETMIYLIRKLLREYSSSNRISHLVNNAQIYIMPSMNPDGFELGQRFNANGVDLNRDFPDWIADPTDTPDGRLGIESKAIMALYDKHHFVLSLNFHGGAACVNIPWDGMPNDDVTKRFGDDPLMNALGREYTNTNRHMHDDGGFDNGLTYGFEWFQVLGGMQDWSNYYRRAIHATVELSIPKWPSANTLPSYWQQNEEALVAHLERGLRGFHLKVVNAQNELINNVTIDVGTAKRPMRFDTGTIHRATLPGAQQVTLSAPGYQSYTANLTAGIFSGEFLTVTLEK
jgi:hypothetical protein